MKKIVFLLLFLAIVLLLAGCSKDDEKNEVVTELPPFKHISNINLLGSKTTDVWGFNQGGKEYAVVGDYDIHTFSIIEVTDPYNPLVVSTTSYPAFDLKVWQNFLYVVDGTHDLAGENSGLIYNISNPEAPLVAGNFPSAHNIFIDDRGYLYLSGRHEIVNGELQEKGITIYNLNNDPAQPEIIWTSDLSPSHDITVIGTRMFDFHQTEGTYIYDVSTPSAPVLLGSAETGVGYDHSGWVTEDSNYLYITNELAASSEFTNAVLGGPDIAIWNISNITNPVKVGEIHDPSSRVHNLYIKGNLAYVSYYGAGLKIFNVTDPVNPVLIYSYDTNGAIDRGSSDGFNGAFGVYPFSNSGSIYVSDMNTDLHIFQPND